MKKIFMASLLAGVLCSGCAVVVTPPPASLPVVLPPQLSSQVTLGMAREDVRSIIGPFVIVGYEIDPLSGQQTPIKEPSLLGTEIVTLGTETFEIDEFIVSEIQKDTLSLVNGRWPLVFQNNVLVAKGADGLAALKAKYQGK